MSRAGRIVRNILLGISIPLFLVAIVYIAVAAFFSKHFFPGTWINGVDCANMTVDEVMRMLQEDNADFIFHLTERGDKSEDLDGRNIGYSIVFSGTADVKAQQSMWLWPLSIMNVNYYSVEGEPSFDEAKLKSAIAALDGISGSDVQAPQDAYVDYSDGVRIVPEVQGTTIDQEKLYGAIAEVILGGDDSLDAEAAGCYQVPAVTVDSESFLEETKDIRRILDMVIRLHIGGDDYVTIDGDVTSKWMYQTEDGGVGIDEEKVKAYMDDLEEKYSTWGDDRKFMTSYGTEVTVEGGNYGWSIDAEHETEQIMKELQAGENVDRDILFDGTAAEWGDDEIGDTYLEISIDNQHMWFYKDGELITDTDIVSGCDYTGHSTPRGTYKILNKAVDQTLKGIDPEDPYESEVSYWLPFIGNTFGVHDSSWRGSYGGSIYYYNGSHGCVNTPYSKMKIIYENIEIGTPVVVW